MTLGQLFSDQVGEYIHEINLKYPNISSKEFCRMVEDYVNKNGNLIEEAIDFDEFDDEDDEESTSKGKSSIDPSEFEEDDDVDVPSTEKKGAIDPSEFGEEDEEPESERRGAAKVERTKMRKIHLEDSRGKEDRVVVKKRKDVDPTDDRYVIHDGVRKKIVKNDPKNKEQDIHYIVDRWYKKAEKKGTNTDKHTELEFLLTSDVTDMSALFAFANVPNIDLSSWDTSNVENMEGMFYRSTFNNDSIEHWDVSACINFRNMFVGSRFSGDISEWIPGEYKEIETTSEGKTVYEEDEDGSMVAKTKLVRARLPEVGARLIDIESETDMDIDDMLDGLGVKVGGTSVLGSKEEKTISKGMKIGESKKHVLTIEEFVNEGLYDNIKRGIKRGVDYVKEKFRAIGVKINDFFVANIDKKTGEVIPVMDPVTSINYINVAKPKGVTAFAKSESPLLADEVQQTATIEERSERYGWIKKGTREYNNFVEFVKMVTDDYVSVAEARVPLNAGSGFNVMDISTKQLKKEIDRVMRNVPGETGKDSAKALCIYGAPGIGKTTIPKEIIKSWNEDNPDKKKAIIVIECGDLELGGFNIPMPKETPMAETIYANSAVKAKLLAAGVTEDDFTNWEKNVKILKTHESPKTWLPVYPKNLPEKEFYAAQQIANGRNLTKLVPDEKVGGYRREKVDTTEGGIIMFDEFLRADPELFKTICQLVMNRSIGHGEFLLGDKWGIILCSNRPCDDTEVKDRYEQLPPAMSNRYLAGMYNFIPDFGDWLDWATTDGHFDDDTIAFISGDNTPFGGTNKDNYTDNRGNVVRAYKNWHTIDPDKFLSGEEPIITTPRGWAALMDWVDDEKRILGVDSILELDMEDLREKACAVIGKTIGNAYADFMEKRSAGYAKKSRPKTEKFFMGDITGEVKTDSYKCDEAVKDIQKYVESHFRKRDLLVIDGIGDKFLTMAENLDKLYAKTVMSTAIKVLHNTIVQKIYKLRSRSKEDKPYIIALKSYLMYVSDKYDVELLPPLE